ncbi:MAG: hypothetical protein ABSG79_26585 [Bryobacteraceae bacterium]
METTGELRSNVVINGSTAYALRVEGQDSGSQMNTTAADGYLPSVEALQEVALQSSSFNAEYGQTGGGLFNFTTKSGTNGLHGSGYEYFGNSFLNAAQPFAGVNGGPLKPPDHRNDFGASLGGPVVLPHYNGRNRTFFFVNYEHFKEWVVRTGGLGSVPTVPERSGDFSQILTGRVLNVDPLGRNILENTIYDPGTTRTQNGAVVRDPFPNNQVPVSQFDPVSSKVLAMIPMPTYSGIVNNFLETWLNKRDFSNKSVKIDENVGSKWKLAGFYSKYHYDNNMHSPGDGLPTLLTGARPQHAYVHTARLNADYSLSPTMMIHLGIGWVRNFQPDHAPAQELAFDAVSQLGLVGSAATPSGMPRMAGLFNNYGGSLNLGPTNANYRMNDKPTSVASATWVRGNHTIKLGGEYRIDIFQDHNQNGSQGIYTFSANETALPSTNGQSLSGGTTGFPFASFMLGLVDNASVRPPYSVQYRKGAGTLFLQDTWKITRKLTLDYGLRWDVFPDDHEEHNRVSTFDPAIPNPSTGNLLGGLLYPGDGAGRCNCSLTKTYPYAIGPRLGVAYQIFSKLVFRGGWGIVYGGNTVMGYAGDANVYGVGLEALLWSNPSFGTAAFNFKQGLQYSPSQLYTATLNPGDLPYTGQINSPPAWWDPNGGRPSRINQWSGGLQYSISPNLLLEAAYVGSRGVWESATGLININAITPQILAAHGLNINSAADQALLTSRLSSATAAARGFSTPPYPTFSTANTVAQALRPFPQFGSISAAHSPLGDSWYDALQTKLTKRYSYGLTLTFSFAFSDELATGEAENDVFNRQTDKYIDVNSQPFVYAMAVNYRIPGVQMNHFAKVVTNGWTVGAITKDASGFPIEIPNSQGNLSSLLERGTFVNRVPGQPLFLKDPNCHCINPLTDFVLNPKAWSEPAPGQFGGSTLFYNDYRQQRVPDEQINFGRIFRISEKVQFQLRAEFFNAFNRTRLVPFATTFNGVASTAINASATQVVSNGQVVSGFGAVLMGDRDMGQNPRTGQLVGRITF